MNPALTAMANAIRVGDHLLERLGGPRWRTPCGSATICSNGWELRRRLGSRRRGMGVLADTTVDLARVQFATTSIYHFLFVPLTLGLGPLVAIMQTLWHRTRDEAWLRLTRSSGRCS